MKKLSLSHFRRLAAISTICFVTFVLGACSPAEMQISDQVADALTALNKNKAVSEQFVKDVKSHVDATDPQYEPIMGRYEDARDLYNEYISEIQSSIKSAGSDFPSSESIELINRAGTAFIAAAARGIDPSVSSRRLDFDRAIVCPSLGKSTAKLSRDARTLLADRVIAGMRWKPWSQL